MATREEKIAFIQSKMAAPAPQGALSAKSREEKIAFIKQRSQEKQEDPGLISDLVDGAAEVGKAVDSYTGAPTRAFIGAAQRVQEPGHSLSDPFTAAYNQFGEDPSLAPTGKQIVQKAGVPDTALSEIAPGLFTDDPEKAKQWLKFQKGGAADITASGAAGFGMELAADATNFIPAAKLIEGANKLAQTGKTSMAVKSASAAEKLAVNATGATAKQTEKFAGDAGRQLLDRKLVRFGDSPERIAERVGNESARAGDDIEKSLHALDAKGVQASADEIVSNLEARVKELANDPSKAPLAKKLQGIIDDITETGRSSIPVSEAEATKRGFGQKIRNWIDPESGAANKEAYLAYMKEVEKKALDADPGLAAKFQEGKKTYGLLAPIQEAAERRAKQLNQHPIGGLLDTAAAGAGAAATGGPGGIATGIATAAVRRAVAPRISSSAAVVLDKLSKTLSGAPRATSFIEKNPAVLQAISKSIQGAASDGAKAADSSPGQRRRGEMIADIKGEKKWAIQGYGKLFNHGDNSALKEPTIVEKLFTTPVGKKLLIAASDLKPGSQAMAKIAGEIKGWPEYAAAAKKPEPIEKPKPMPMQKPKTTKLSYPKKLTKGEYSAVVNSDQEYIEARREGWK